MVFMPFGFFYTKVVPKYRLKKNFGRDLYEDITNMPLLMGYVDKVQNGQQGQHVKTILNRIEGLKRPLKFFKRTGTLPDFAAFVSLTKIEQTLSYLDHVCHQIRPAVKTSICLRRSKESALEKGKYLPQESFLSMAQKLARVLDEKEALALEFRDEYTYFEFQKFLLVGFFCLMPVQRRQIFAELEMAHVIHNEEEQCYVIRVVREKSAMVRMEQGLDITRYISIPLKLSGHMTSLLTIRQELLDKHLPLLEDVDREEVKYVFREKCFRKRLYARRITDMVQSGTKAICGIAVGPLEYRHLRATYFYELIMNDTLLTKAEKDRKLSDYAQCIGHSLDVFLQHYVYYDIAELAERSANISREANKGLFGDQLEVVIRTEEPRIPYILPRDRVEVLVDNTVCMHV